MTEKNRTLAEIKAPETAGDPWTTIAVGSIVLATEGKADGWWESIVVAVEPTDDSLTLTWRDWPRMPSFRAPRRSVAVIGPEAQ